MCLEANDLPFYFVGAVVVLVVVVFTWLGRE